MTLRFSSPTDEPCGCFHPDSRFHGFREEGVYWPTVTQHLLARGLADPKDRERVRMNARDPDDARAMAASMPRAPDCDADARTAEALLHALRRTFETNLAIRAVLVDTRDQRIEADLGDDATLGVGRDGRGENRLGAALEAVRAVVRERAERVNAIQCEHQGAEATGLMCACLLATRASYERPRRYHRRFTGEGAAYELICPACRDALPAAPPLRVICRDCFEGYLGAERLADVGAPAFRARASGLRFAHRLVTFAGLAVDDVIAATPVARTPHVWLAVRRDGALVRFDVARGAAGIGGRIDAGARDTLDLAGSIELHVSPGGGLAVVVESKGRRALVIEPASGRVVRALERDAYHPEHCRYPLGLFELDGRVLLVHATEWNRLDVTDPRTGERLTERATPRWTAARGRPEHGLDYFHAGLVVSPDGERVIDNGWIWHPWGEVRVFSLRRLALENRWESENGESVRALAGRSYYWDGPVAWLDARTVAIWGDGDDDTNLTPAARLFDVETGEERGSFAGPARGLAVVRDRLISFDALDAGAGTSAWDWRTGERLAHDPTFAPAFAPAFAIAAHPRSHELLSRSTGGALRVSELVGE